MLTFKFSAALAVNASAAIAVVFAVILEVLDAILFVLVVTRVSNANSAAVALVISAFKSVVVFVVSATILFDKLAVSTLRK
jgi:hypothetical protein